MHLVYLELKEKIQNAQVKTAGKKSITIQKKRDKNETKFGNTNT